MKGLGLACVAAVALGQLVDARPLARLAAAATLFVVLVVYLAADARR